TKGPGFSPGPLRLRWLRSLEVHAAARRHGGHRLFLLRHFGHHGFRGYQQAGDRSRVLQGRAHDLGRVDDALGHQVAVVAGLRVIAVRVLVLLHDLADHDRAVCARVDRDLARRGLQRLADDFDTVPLVLVFGTKTLEPVDSAQQCSPAARQDAFLDRGTGRVHRVIDAILALLHLDLGGPTDANYRNAARELGKPLLQLLAIVVGGCLLDLRLDLGNARLDVGFLACTVDDRRVLLVDHHLLGAAEHGDRDVLELDAEIFADRLTARQDGNVLQHGLAAIAEPGRLDCRDLQAAAQLVDDERGKRLALDILGDDE